MKTGHCTIGLNYFFGQDFTGIDIPLFRIGFDFCFGFRLYSLDISYLSRNLSLFLPDCFSPLLTVFFRRFRLAEKAHILFQISEKIIPNIQKIQTKTNQKQTTKSEFNIPNTICNSRQSINLCITKKTYQTNVKQTKVSKNRSLATSSKAKDTNFLQN